MGQTRLFLTFFSASIIALSPAYVGCSSKKKVPSAAKSPIISEAKTDETIKPVTLDAEAVSKALLSLKWKDILDLTEGVHEPLARLVRLRAQYELKDYEIVLQSESLKDPRYVPYEMFLKILSAFEAKNYDATLQFQIPTDLPRPLRERLWMIRGDVFREKNDLLTALRVFKSFHSEFPRSTFQTEVMLRMADVELALDHQDKALDIYESIYKGFPIRDNDDIARQKLLESKRFEQIDTDTHLARVQQLKRAARFKRAEKELRDLAKNSKTPAEKNRIELAQAQLQFAQRNYSEVEEVASDVLKRLNAQGKDIQTKQIYHEWQELYAWSLTRQNKHDDGVAEYQKLLLQKGLAESTREVVLYRLGMIALDDLRYDDATNYLKELRVKFPNGRYQESAHWFGALSMYLAEIRREPPLEMSAQKKVLRKAMDLLEMTTQLPQAEVLAPQALYWKGLIAQQIGDRKMAKLTWARLEDSWTYSFPRLLQLEKPFHFLDEESSVKTESLLTESDFSNVTINEGTNIHFDRTFSKDISWQRLEAFRSVGLQTWAKMELDRFVQDSRNRGPAFYLAVAERFQNVEDWSNLVRWVDRNLDRPLFRLDLKDPVVRLHYPLAHRNAVVKAAEEFKVPPYLILSVMREESRFQADAISRAGALGLMQIMPNLGERLGADLKDSRAKRSQLTNPEISIRYGAYHLKELMERVNRMDIPANLRWVVIVASYNAGIEPVLRWLKNKDTSSLGIFVESIPYTETRYYVKRVLQTANIYYHLYGGPAHIKKEVARRKKVKSQVGSDEPPRSIKGEKL